MKAVTGSALMGMLVFALSAPAAAGSSDAAKAAKNPEEVVCEKIEVPGSRLISKKLCLTRAQWAERQMQERQSIDKAQKTGMKGGS